MLFVLDRCYAYRYGEGIRRGNEMTITSADHYEMIAMFEKEFQGMRLDKEADKARWAKGNVYQSGETNALFLAYRRGAAYGRATA
jgi:hypothetical protein